jgi:hypothetical protein
VLGVSVYPVHAQPSPEQPYSCQRLDAEQRRCAFDPKCDQSVIERLRRECLRDGGTVRYRVSGHRPHKDGQPARRLAVGTPAFPPKDSGTRSTGYYSLPKGTLRASKCSIPPKV